MFVGFAILMASVVLAHFLMYVIAEHTKFRDKYDLPISGGEAVGNVFRWIYLFLVVGFMMTMLWAGNSGSLDTPKAGVIEMPTAGMMIQTKEGDNKPEKKSDELNQQAVELQKESTEDWRKFASDAVKNAE
jgi:hypothetical protein